MGKFVSEKEWEPCALSVKHYRIFFVKCTHKMFLAELVPQNPIVSMSPVMNCRTVHFSSPPVELEARKAFRVIKDRREGGS